MSMIINTYRFGGGGGGGGGGDPYFANVVLLLHCDGADESTTFTDSSGSAHTVTANGNAQIDTSEKKFGTGAALFDSLGDYLEIADSDAWHFGSGDFTIEFWVRFDSVASNRPILAQRQTGFAPVAINRNGTQITALLSFTNSAWAAVPTLASGSSTIAVDTWYYVALTRSGSTFKLWLDGVEVDDYTSASSFTNSTNPLIIGNSSFSTTGRLDDIRVTKGVARYTSNFTPPTAAFPDS